MKRQLLSGLILLFTMNAASAQTNTDLVGTSKRFFVNCIRHGKAEQSNIISAFQKNGNAQIFFYETHQTPDLADLLFFTQKRDRKFQSEADKPLSVAAGFPASVSVKEITDSSDISSAQHYDIRVAVSDVIQDSEYSYVAFRFKSIGALAPFYTGYLLCKYDNHGVLVKYSLIEE